MFNRSETTAYVILTNPHAERNSNVATIRICLTLFKIGVLIHLVSKSSQILETSFYSIVSSHAWKMVVTVFWFFLKWRGSLIFWKSIAPCEVKSTAVLMKIQIVSCTISKFLTSTKIRELWQIDFSTFYLRWRLWNQLGTYRQCDLVWQWLEIAMLSWGDDWSSSDWTTKAR